MKFLPLKGNQTLIAILHLLKLVVDPTIRESVRELIFNWYVIKFMWFNHLELPNECQIKLYRKKA